MLYNRLVAAPVTRPILPPLIQTRDATVKLLLPQSLIDVVVSLTQPTAEPQSAANVWRVRLHVVI